MPITTLPEHLKPMVEKAAEAIYNHWEFAPQVPWVPGGNSKMQDKARAFARVGFLSTLNACLEGGVAAEADGFNRIDGMVADSTPRPDGATFDFPALILSLGEAK